MKQLSLATLFAFLLLAGPAVAESEGEEKTEASSESKGEAEAKESISESGEERDARIKQLVFNEGDVYTITTRYGYQTNIVLSSKEEIQTISVGDKSMWQIIPSGTRIFIRPMEEDIMTNMTVITDRRSYQFDIKSLGPADTDGNIYVASFIYPDDILAEQQAAEAAAIERAAEEERLAKLSGKSAPFSGEEVVVFKPGVSPKDTAATQAAPVAESTSAPVVAAVPANVPFGGPTPAPGTAPAPLMAAAPAMPSAPVTVAPPPPVNLSSANYNYTYSGSDTLAPLQVFDDGKSTYLKYTTLADPLPDAYVLDATGQVVSARRSVSGQYVVVDAVVPEMILKNSSGSIHVFNEAMSQP